MTHVVKDLLWESKSLTHLPSESIWESFLELAPGRRVLGRPLAWQPSTHHLLESIGESTLGRQKHVL